MSAVAFIIGGTVGLWCGFLWGYLSRVADDRPETRTMSDPDPKILTFTRSTTLSRGHR